MDVTLKIKVNSGNDTNLSYYHSQDGTTYTPTITKTAPLFNIIRVKEK